uniref:Ovule protein n=1 Tax=Heterorhabditis bacteriophora TaxID=37862 RepID=A0A1I7X1N3_HETBA
MKLQNIFSNWSCTKRRLLPLFGGRQVESSTTTSWILAKTITAMKYCKKINKVHEELRRLHPTLVSRKRPILVHVSQMTLLKLNELDNVTPLYPVYSLDLSD